MRILSRLLVVSLVLGIAGCTNATSDNDSSSAGAGSTDGGSVSDQTSAAYFQQAVGDRVLFPVDQSTLTDVARTTLVAQAVTEHRLQSNHRRPCRRAGHTRRQHRAGRSPG
jgi:peptidoglycan-associated lipoprotein